MHSHIFKALCYSRLKVRDNYIRTHSRGSYVGLALWVWFLIESIISSTSYEYAVNTSSIVSYLKFNGICFEVSRLKILFDN